VSWEPVIGLEVHAQLSTRTKMFCGCAASFGADPNTQTCPVCLGLPGALPVANAQAVEFAMRLGFALGCDVQATSVFARKNYFYPDVPKNYQISQFDRPICRGGAVGIELDGVARSVALERAHLEEDAGKLVHDDAGGGSLVDLNRAGVPLLEIVTLPVLRSPEEAGAYLTALRQLVRWLGVCDGNMEEGSLRCDANISLRRPGAALGTKIELKNMNSIRGVVAALHHEIARQSALLDAGGTVSQETRSWDPDRGVTEFLRSKEFAHDYRYFPDPDLPPVQLSEEHRQAVRAAMPELPAARRRRLARDHGIPGYDAAVLTESRELADWFESAAVAAGDGKAVSNWMMGEVLRELNDRGVGIAQFPLTPLALAELVSLVGAGKISGKIAKDVFASMIETGKSAAEIVSAQGLRQIDDTDELARRIAGILEAHPAQVAQYLEGKESLLGFFVGQLMQATRGQANPGVANRLIREGLEARRSG